MSGGRVPLGTALSNPSSKRAYVRRLFATIADRYDLITILLSFGLDRGWKRRLVSRAGPVAGKRALDLACGTGDIAFQLAAHGASVVGLDITHRMVHIAREKGRLTASAEASPPERFARRRKPASTASHPAPRAPHPGFIVADMLSIPFADQQFEIVTTGYGLRNVPVLQDSLSEIHRVLCPGGILLSLDFNRPQNGIVRAAYLAYLTAVGSTLGFILHRDPDTYRYIPHSIRRYPGAPAVVNMLRDAGFTAAEWAPVLGGLMAIHVARKGSEETTKARI